MMKEVIKKILVKIGLRHPAKGVKISPERKAQILLSYKKPEMTVFVETGTEFGTMIEAIKGFFEEIYSVELNYNSYKNAVNKFKDEKNIYLYHGDSSIEISKVLQKVKSPALFWLDAHGGGQITFDNSPIEMELRAIFDHHIKGHVILIDDARHFKFDDIKIIKKIAKNFNYHCIVDDGLFRITPNF